MYTFNLLVTYAITSVIYDSKLTLPLEHCIYITNVVVALIWL